MGMTFTDIENKSAKRLIGIAAVIFLHLCCLYSDVRFSKQYSKPAEKPVELQIIQDIAASSTKTGRAETKGKTT